MRYPVLIITLIATAAILAACGGSPAPSEPTTPVTPTQPPPTTATIDAKQIYSTRCIACHGANREGVTGLGLPLTPKALEQQTDDILKEVITKGRTGTAMVGFEGQLSDAEIAALLKLFRTEP